MSAQEIIRPNGKTYRPRGVVTHAVGGDDDETTGVVVLGTHDVGVAKPLADRYAAWIYDATSVAVDPVLVWWRDGMESGRRAFVDDPVRGRAGVYFRDIVERTP